MQQKKALPVAAITYAKWYDICVCMCVHESTFSGCFMSSSASQTAFTVPFKLVRVMSTDVNSISHPAPFFFSFFGCLPTHTLPTSLEMFSQTQLFYLPVKQVHRSERRKTEDGTIPRDDKNNCGFSADCIDLLMTHSYSASMITKPSKQWYVL